MNGQLRLAAMLDLDAELVAGREGIMLISEGGFAWKVFEQELAELGVELLRPSSKRAKQRYGEPMLKKVRPLIESANDALKGRLDPEQHAGGFSRASRTGWPSGSWRWLPGSGTTTRPATRRPLADRV